MGWLQLTSDNCKEPYLVNLRNVKYITPYGGGIRVTFIDGIQKVFHESYERVKPHLTLENT